MRPGAASKLFQYLSETVDGFAQSQQIRGRDRLGLLTQRGAECGIDPFQKCAAFRRKGYVDDAPVLQIVLPRDKAGEAEPVDDRGDVGFGEVQPAGDFRNGERAVPVQQGKDAEL